MTNLVKLTDLKWQAASYSSNRLDLDYYLAWLESLSYVEPKTISLGQVMINDENWPAMELDGKRYQMTKLSFESILNRFGLRSRGFMKLLSFPEFLGAVGLAVKNAQKISPSRFAVSDGKVYATYSEHYKQDSPRESIEFIEKWFKDYGTAVGLFFHEFWKEERLFRVFWDIKPLDPSFEVPDAEGFKGDFCLVYESSSFGFASEKLLLALRRKDRYYVLSEISRQVHKGDFCLDHVIEDVVERMLEEFMDAKRTFLKLDRMVFEEPQKALEHAFEICQMTEESRNKVQGQANFWIFRNKRLTAGMLLRFLSDEMADKKLAKTKETKWASDIFKNLFTDLCSEKGFGPIELKSI